MTILQHSIAQAAAATGYQISRSLRFNSADSANLTRTPSVAGNRQKWTWSGWVKKARNGTAMPFFATRPATGASNTNTIQFGFDSSDKFGFGFETAYYLVSTQVFRDPSAFYHFNVVFDAANGTAANRIRVWVNGVEITAFSTDSRSAISAVDHGINIASQIHQIGSLTSNTWYGDFYLADINFIDGQTLDPTSFGQTDANTGVWVPKTYTGTFGTNGFWLKFDDNSGTTSTTLGKDSSGNSNNWTPNNFSVTAGAGNDSLVDSPTNYGTDTGVGGEVRGNYCTMNPLIQGSSLANGNLDQAASTVVNFGTMGVSTGKWYYEATITAQPSGGLKIGVGAAGTASEIGQGADGWAIICQSNANNGQVINNGTLGTDYTNFAVNDVVMVAFDMDTGKLYFGKNGTWLNSAVPASGTGAVYTNLSGTLFPASTAQTGGAFSWNFGQRPFAYTAPSGFKALCTQNLPTPTIGTSSTTLADDYFNIALYTGTGANLSVTGIGFQPDFVWIKGRSGATDHGLYDAVRGVQKQIESNTTAAETTESTGLTAFGSDGFTVGSLAQLNTNTATYVAWNWKAGGTASTNTSGSITSNVSVSTTAGISVVTYTIPSASATIETFGHGLGRAPSMVILKVRGNVDEWTVYNANLTTPLSNWLTLNTTAAAGGATSTFSSSSTTFGVRGTRLLGSGTSGNIVAYCFAEIAGFSRFGSYTGNGSTDGPFVYCGFRPRWILVKRTDAVSDWEILDTSRDTYNAAALLIQPNLSGAETSTGGPWYDIVSNGFKVRTSNTFFNASGGTYIFAAFAETPLNFARAR